ncbi:hypothetical protein [Brevibacterium aurantiacum]|uniref:Uncharacterized protein n=1 Tax=Brevibacterium aurantiacum TaxID=273384 RepID=A0A556C1G3_BREAU|nr:hypothetical protein [Brevibacterium aurantiacum]TSI11304.1 hypothetical protein FO013_21900 [Brevibacterium aurantiacum]
MSHNPVHRKRRIWWLYVPIIVVATITYFLSFNHTLTLNGLGLLAMIVAFGGLAAIVKEGSTL